ncbi:acetyl-CoA carboxylase carboxyltransferase subunit beta [Bdellovibrionota bacterium]
MWFLRKKPSIQQSHRLPNIPSGMWKKCDGCHEVVLREDIEKNLSVCPRCDYHYRFSARERLGLIVDEHSFRELDSGLFACDPLRFEDYTKRIKKAEQKSSENEAFVAGAATIEKQPVQIGTFNFAFMGGSMGSVVGEKVARLFERSVEKREPAVVISTSGGARMQEGVLSLMQMAKTTLALSRLRESGVPYISILTDPTTGGVAASFAFLGDVILAEPNSPVIELANEETGITKHNRSISRLTDPAPLLIKDGILLNQQEKWNHK